VVPLAARPGEGVVALFNASDDTVHMLESVLSVAGLTLLWCRFADVRKGHIDFGEFIQRHNPEVVIFDISPPYGLNWNFFATMRDHQAMKGRGVVLTTTNKQRLDEIVDADSHALEVVGKPADLERLQIAIEAESCRAANGRRRLM
jgi:DNA-binding response OmpR family regulator